MLYYVIWTDEFSSSPASVVIADGRSLTRLQTLRFGVLVIFVFAALLASQCLKLSSDLLGFSIIFGQEHFALLVDAPEIVLAEVVLPKQLVEHADRIERPHDRYEDILAVLLGVLVFEMLCVNH